MYNLVHKICVEINILSKKDCIKIWFSKFQQNEGCAKYLQLVISGTMYIYFVNFKAFSQSYFY